MSASRFTAPTHADNPGTIVLGERRADVRSLVHACLESLGHRVLPSTSAEDVVEISRSNRADVVLLDTELLDSHAIKTLEQLDFGSTHATVVLLTATGNDERTRQALAMGAQDTVGLPLMEQELVSRVDTAVRTKRRLDNAAGIDSLTGMWNRRRLIESLTQCAALAQRYQHPLSVVLIDLDHLAVVNERHGMSTGDAVLRAAAEHIAADLRSTDITGRWDGDKFLLVLPHTKVSGAEVLAERLRLTLAELPVEMPGAMPVGTSACFACVEHTDVTTLLETAMELIRDGKRAGRNTVRRSNLHSA